MHIGLIGGIGPAATVAYYLRIVAGLRARGRVAELTIAHADMDRLIANAAAGDAVAQARVYAGHVAQLKAAGAQVAAITSLGGHFCLAEARAIAALPLVGAIAPIEAHCAARGIGCLGLIGTRYVMESGLYGQLRRTRTIAPEEMDAVHQAYTEMARTGHCTDNQRALFFEAGARLIARGADAVLLGGTDLGLAFDGQTPGFAVVDAAAVHADRLVAIAAGEAEHDS